MKKMCMIVALIGLTSNSVFADRKGYTAVNCLTNNYNHPMERSLEGLVNLDEYSHRSVWCPVALNVEGDGTIEARVRLINDTDVEEGGICELKAGAYSQAYWPHTAGEHELVMGPISTQNSSRVILSCMIPKRAESRIISYEIEQ